MSQDSAMEARSGDRSRCSRVWSRNSGNHGNGRPSLNTTRSDTSNSSRCTSFNNSWIDLEAQKEMRKSVEESMQAYTHKMREIMECRMKEQSRKSPHERSPTRSIGMKRIYGGRTQHHFSKAGMAPSRDTQPASPCKGLNGLQCRAAATSTPMELSPNTDLASSSSSSKKMFDPRIGVTTHRKIVFNSGPKTRSASKRTLLTPRIGMGSPRIDMVSPRIDIVSPQEINVDKTKNDTRLVLPKMTMESENDLNDPSEQILKLRLQSSDEMSSVGSEGQGNVTSSEESEKISGWSRLAEDDSPLLARNLCFRFHKVHKRKKWRLVIERDSLLVEDTIRDMPKDSPDISSDDDPDDSTVEESLQIIPFPELENAFQIDPVFGSVEDGLDPDGYQCESRVCGALGGVRRLPTNTQGQTKRHFDLEIQRRRARRWAQRRSMNRPRFRIGNTTFRYSIAVALALSRMGCAPRKGKRPSWAVVLPNLDLYELRRAILLRARKAAQAARLSREKSSSAPSTSGEPIIAAIERMNNGPMEDLRSVLRKRDSESNQVKKMVQFLLPDIVPSKS